MGNFEFIRIEYGEGRALAPSGEGEEEEESRRVLIQDVVAILTGLESEVRDLLAKV